MADFRYIEYFKIVDCRDCYFSYGVDLTNRIQTILQSEVNRKMLNYNNRYFWNSYLLERFAEVVDCSEIILPVICGFFDFKTIKIDEDQFGFGIISRR